MTLYTWETISCTCCLQTSAQDPAAQKSNARKVSLPLPLLRQLWWKFSVPDSMEPKICYKKAFNTEWRKKPFYLFEKHSSQWKVLDCLEVIHLTAFHILPHWRSLKPLKNILQIYFLITFPRGEHWKLIPRDACQGRNTVLSSS